MRPICTICSSHIRVVRSSIINSGPARLDAPAGAFELVVIRHGRTAWNASGRYQGHTDIPLDEVGRAQAAAIARELADYSFDIAVTSDLSRARETAAIVLGARACPLECDPRWRELYFGAWEGLTREEIDARTPPVPQGPPGTPVRFPTPDGGESFDAFNVRIAAALHSVRERMHPGGRALVATHAGPLHAVLRGLLGESEAAALDVKFVPASITTFVVEPHVARLTALNRIAAALPSAGAERGRE